mmetsp:Transcript_12091/g.24318  ORF Transcript_12091/g.24318 Transcript_12091/m.24318 type:complete len:127 (-) Transcript_12091:1537-1917(-)
MGQSENGKHKKPVVVPRLKASEEEAEDRLTQELLMALRIPHVQPWLPAMSSEEPLQTSRYRRKALPPRETHRAELERRRRTRPSTPDELPHAAPQTVSKSCSRSSSASSLRRAVPSGLDDEPALIA